MDLTLLSSRAAAVAILAVSSGIVTADAYTLLSHHRSFRSSFFLQKPATTRLFIYPPPGSGYLGPEDEEPNFPDTYKPLMQYPGTMRPGTTPENMPFSDLPIGDNDPDPVPWPHFQQIEWHHKWDPPHPHPIPMEEFIEMQGRWATPEMEATMRAGVRRDVRQRQEQEAAERRDMIITDDDDDDDDIADEPIALGDGMFGKLGSDDDRAITAAAVVPPPPGEAIEEASTDDDVEDDEDALLDNFLLDLGLDTGDDDDDDDKTVGDDIKPTASKSAADETDDDDDLEDLFSLSLDAGESKGPQLVLESGESSATISVDEDDELDLGLDDDDGMDDDAVNTVPLDDFGDDEESLDGENIFGDGGFDYDGGDFDSDGGDMW